MTNIFFKSKEAKARTNSKVFLIIACLALVIFSGCSKDDEKENPIIGAWVHENTLFSKCYTFKADGTGSYEYILNISFGSSKSENAFEWSAAGTKITIVRTSGTATMAEEIFFDSRADLIYDVEDTDVKYTRRKT